MSLSRRTLALVLAGVVLLVALVVGVVVALGGGDGDGGGGGEEPVAAVRPAFLRDVPQDGVTLGDPGAPALEEFADVQCPFCADAEIALLPDIVDRYVKTGKLKLVWRGLAFLGPDSLEGLRAIDAAAHQDRLWDVAHKLFERQGTENSGWVTEELLDEIGRSTPGLDFEQWKDDWDSQRTRAIMAQADEAALDAGVRGTPTFVFDGQQLQLQALDIESFAQALAAIDPSLG